MKTSALISKALTTSPLAAAILMTTAFALAPEAARAETPQDSVIADAQRSYVEEVRFEQTCEDWQKVRRCANAAGEVQLECAAKSPLAKFWAMLRGERPRDEEVKVIRIAPADSPAATSEQQADLKQQAASSERHTTKIVKKGELPACRENG